MESFINACRLCLWKGEKMVSIFSDDADIQKKIHTCLPVRVHEDDIVTKQICYNCNYKLEIFCEFYNICVRSDNILQQYLLNLNSTIGEMQETSPVSRITTDTQLSQLSDEDIECVFGQNPDTTESANTNETQCINPRTVVVHDGIEEIDLTEDQSQECDTDSIFNSTEIVGQKKCKPLGIHSLNSEPQGNLQDIMMLPNDAFFNYHIESSPAKGREKREFTHCTPERVKPNISQILHTSPISHENVCQYCDKIFSNANACAAHIEGHLKKHYCVCKFCKRAFISEVMLQLHNANDCRLSTKLPQNNFNGSVKQLYHDLQSKTAVVKLKPINVCVKCSKICKSKAELEEHSNNCQVIRKRKYKKRKFKRSLIPIRTRALKKIQVDIIKEVIGKGDTVSSKDLEQTLLESVGLRKISNEIIV